MLQGPARCILFTAQRTAPDCQADVMSSTWCSTWWQASLSAAQPRDWLAHAGARLLQEECSSVVGKLPSAQVTLHAYRQGVLRRHTTTQSNQEHRRQQTHTHPHTFRVHTRPILVTTYTQQSTRAHSTQHRITCAGMWHTELAGDRSICCSAGASQIPTAPAAPASRNVQPHRADTCYT